jgi:hypothetical protein
MIVNVSTGEHETWMAAERAAPDRLLYAASHSVYGASNGLLDNRVTGPLNRAFVQHESSRQSRQGGFLLSSLETASFKRRLLKASLAGPGPARRCDAADTRGPALLNTPPSHGGFSTGQYHSGPRFVTLKHEPAPSRRGRMPHGQPLGTGLVNRW